MAGRSARSQVNPEDEVAQRELAPFGLARRREPDVGMSPGPVMSLRATVAEPGIWMQGRPLRPGPRREEAVSAARRGTRP